MTVVIARNSEPCCVLQVGNPVGEGKFVTSIPGFKSIRLTVRPNDPITEDCIWWGLTPETAALGHNAPAEIQRRNGSSRFERGVLEPRMMSCGGVRCRMLSRVVAVPELMSCTTMLYVGL